MAAWADRVELCSRRNVELPRQYERNKVRSNFSVNVDVHKFSLVGSTREVRIERTRSIRTSSTALAALAIGPRRHG